MLLLDTDPMSWRPDGSEYGNGEGRFFYPPLNWKDNAEDYIMDSPIESIRWEYLREGIEDWEYLTILRSISESPEMKDSQKEIARKFLSIPSTIVGDVDSEYSVTPEEMIARRNKIGKFITCFFNGEDYTEDEHSEVSSHSKDASSIIRPALIFVIGAVLSLFLKNMSLPKT